MTHPLTSVLLLAACILAALAIYGWPRRTAPGATLLLPLLACAVVWSSAAALELWASSDVARVLWHRVSWLGRVPLPLVWLLFCVDFTGAWPALRTRRAAGLLAAPAGLALLLLAASMLESGRAARLVALEAVELVTALAQLYGWLLTSLGLAFLMRRFTRSQSIYRSQCAVLLLAGTIPLVVHLWHLLDPFLGIDPTPASFNVAGLVLGWGLFSYRLFDMTPIAYETVFNAMGDGVFVTDARGRITSVNPVALSGVGRRLDEVLGRPLEELFANWPDAGSPAGPPRERVELNVVAGGRERDVELRAFPVYDGERRLYGRVYISQDVTDRNAYQRRIEEMAYRDFLTSLPNRRALYEEAQRALSFARRRELEVALLFIDLDGFKDINDALGHPAGDLLLQYVASRLQATTRKEDILARLGGDEFALLLYDCDATGARSAAERVLQGLREPAFEVRRTRIHLQASVGIAVYTGGPKSVDELLAQADTAMYQAKQGPDRIHLYEGHEEPHLPGEARPEDEFRQALRAGQLIFKYQPIIDLATGSVLAAEALVRWEHPTRGLTHPSSFLSMVEERDLALELDRYALQHALAEVAGSPFDVSINLSARSVLDSQLV
jgi:diguanylate cyclase (GGDEF)-like protein/PAS domain S-box-containing protein